MKQDGFKVLITIGITAIIIITVGYFAWRPLMQYSTTPFSGACTSQTVVNIDLIEKFEAAQMKRNANEVLGLFTSPITASDTSDYIFFSGSDTSGPRLYSSGGTNFNEPSFIVVDSPRQNTSSTCITKVQEQRSYYPEGVGGNFGPTQTTTVYFVTTIENSSWKIKSYLSNTTDTRKFGGWYRY